MAARDNQALILQISADVRGLQKAMDKAQGIVATGSRNMERSALRGARAIESANDNIGKKLGRNLGREFSAGLDEIGSRAGRATGLLSGLGVAGTAAAVGIGAVVAAFAQAKAAVQFGDAIADSAAKIGVSTDTLQEYRFAIHQLGGEYTDADQALSKFTQTLGKAQTIGGKSLKAFKALEIDPQKFHDAEAALDAVLDKLSRIPDESKRQGLAAALGLEEFIPLARLSTAETDRLREAARNLGFVMDKDLIAKAGEVNDKLEDLQQVVSVQLASAFVELAPYILKAAEAMVKGAQFARDLAATLQDVKSWADSLGLSPLGKWFDDLLGHILPVIGPLRNIQDALRGIQGVKNPLQESVKDFAKTGRVSGDEAVRAFYAPKVKPFNPAAPSSGGGGKSRAASAPKDRSDQIAAQIEEQFRQTQRDLLNAWRDQLVGADQRADLSKELLDLDRETFNARLDQQVKEIRAAEGTSKAKQDELIAALELVRLEQGKVDELKREAIDRETVEQKARERASIAKSQLDADNELLGLQASVARTAEERRDIELRRLQLAEDIEREEIRLLRAQGGAANIAEANNRERVLNEGAPARRQGVLNDTAGPWEKYVNDIKSVDEAFQDMAVGGVNSLIDGLAAASVGAANLGDVFRQTLQQMAMEVNRILLQQLLVGGQGGGGGFLKSLFKFGASAVGGGYTGSGGAFAIKGIDGGFIPYASGGHVRGPGTGTSDSIFARLSDGEFVVNANATRRHRRILEALNAGHLPRFADGGYVGGDILRNLSRQRASGPSSSSFTWGGNVVINAAPGMTSRDARRAGQQAAGALMTELAVARRKGYA